MPRNAPAEDKPTVTYGSGRTSQDGFAFAATASPPDLRLMHYNDVYHLDPSSAEPMGGIARFITAVNQYRSDERFQGQSELVSLFSGDAFNPSLESSVTKGEHMVPVLNQIGTDCACVGVSVPPSLPLDGSTDHGRTTTLILACCSSRP